MTVKVESFEDQLKGAGDGAYQGDAKQQPEKGKYRSAVSAPDLNDILKAQMKKLKEATPAPDFYEPIKPGKYEARVVSAESCMVGAKETLAIKVCFLILQGEYAGHHAWMTVWLTDRALPIAKRALVKLGITDADDLNSPELKTYQCEIRVVVNDDGYNDVKSFKVIGRCEAVPVHHAFPPKADCKED